MNIIDFHTHAFPDSLAARAVAHLEGECEEAKAHLDGTVDGLVESMDRNGISRSVVLNIATKPSQFEPILSWCREIASARIIAFPSVHPDDPAAAERIREISDAGLPGIKLHPYYQSFTFDEERLLPVYRALEENHLVLLTHAGFDIAYDRYRAVDPEKILNIHRRFPDLTVVASHMGAWEDWDQVEEHLIGTGVYIDVSYSLHILERSRARDLIIRHGTDRVLFGSDSPWEDQGTALRMFRELELGDEAEEAILVNNAERILGLEPVGR